ncbi:cytochrome P450 2H2 [Ixodes scapularis]
MVPDAVLESRNTRLAVLLAVFAGFLIHALSRRRQQAQKSKLPPGPKGLPIVGNLFFISKCFKPDQCAQWAREYGPVFRINMGIGNVVILNDFESIKTFMTRKDMVHRPSDWIIRHSGVLGVATLNGKPWVDNRRVCLNALRELGIGQTSMKERVREECQYLVKRIADWAGVPNLLEEYLKPSVSNNITALVFGRRYDYDDARRKYMDDRLDETIDVLTQDSIVSVLPLWAFNLMALIPSSTCNFIKSLGHNLLQYTRNQVKEYRESQTEKGDWHFIDSYLKTIKEHEDDSNSSYTMDHLLGNVLSFFVAGSTTVRSAIQWNVLYLASQPDNLQLMIQREIDEVVGKDRSPSWEDHENMPLTVATIWEMFRWRTDSTFGGPREIIEDIVVGEYSIPKGTMLLPNVRAVHSDPRLWKNPEDFDPFRFLSEDGTCLVPKPEYLIPFSLGRRMCPGEILGMAEVFLYVASIFQRFRVLPQEGVNINLAPRSQNFHVPFPQKLRFVPRCADNVRPL